MKDPDKNILLVLGAPNSPEGLLSPVAISRLDTCYSLYKQENAMILVTGGFGPHFNISNKPHAWYAKQYLVGKGVPAHHIVDGVESSNTLEDATLSKPLIVAYNPSRVTIITSEYHLQRAGIIFCTVYQDLAPLRFIAAPSYALKLPELQVLLQHEANAIQRLLLNGVIY